MLQLLLGANFSHFNHTIHEHNMSCRTSNGTPFRINSKQELADLQFLDTGLQFYAYLTPILIIIGIIGNTLSLIVFTSKSMRKMSVSYYLGALAASDIMVLLTAVLLEWFTIGLPKWPGGHQLSALLVEGMCQTFLFLSYAFRFLSAWLIVIFTIERYIGVCKPLRRREKCTVSFARKAIACLTAIAILISSYKPALNGVTGDIAKRCGAKQDYDKINFILDSCYGLIITAVPFVIITSLNLLITRNLLNTRRRHKKSKFLTEENFVKLEFTFVLLIISTGFVALNLPYFVIWSKRNLKILHTMLTPGLGLHTMPDRLHGLLYITKTIFHLNYSSNFFVYSLTGAHFREQLKGILCNQRNNRPMSVLHMSRAVMSHTTYVTVASASPSTSMV